MRIFIIILFLFLILCAASVIIAAIAVFIEEENIRETIYGEVWEDER